jgi:nicotinamide-nucleotide amidase
MTGRPEEIIGDILRSSGQTLGTAESCTGGRIGHRITAVPGSSSYYAGGFVTYSNRLKECLLGVPAETLEESGAVSEETARAMASGARKALGTDYALAVTGIAGPGGGTKAKPAGLVYIGVAGPSGCRVRKYIFEGGRAAVREAAAQQALVQLREELTAS